MNAPFEKFTVMHIGHADTEKRRYFEVNVFLGDDPPLGETQRRFIEDAIRTALGDSDTGAFGCQPPISRSTTPRSNARAPFRVEMLGASIGQQSTPAAEDAIAKALEQANHRDETVGHQFYMGMYRDCRCGWRAPAGSWNTGVELRKLWAEHARASGEDAIREPGASHPSGAGSSAANAMNGTWQPFRNALAKMQQEWSRKERTSRETGGAFSNDARYWAGAMFALCEVAIALPNKTESIAAKQPAPLGESSQRRRDKGSSEGQ